MGSEEIDSLAILRKTVKEQRQLLNYGYHLIKVMDLKIGSNFMSRAVNHYLKSAEQYGMIEDGEFKSTGTDNDRI